MSPTQKSIDRYVERDGPPRGNPDDAPNDRNEPLGDRRGDLAEQLHLLSIKVSNEPGPHAISVNSPPDRRLHNLELSIELAGPGLLPKTFTIIRFGGRAGGDDAANYEAPATPPEESVNGDGDSLARSFNSLSIKSSPRRICMLKKRDEEWKAFEIEEGFESDPFMGYESPRYQDTGFGRERGFEIEKGVETDPSMLYLSSSDQGTGFEGERGFEIEKRFESDPFMGYESPSDQDTAQAHIPTNGPDAVGKSGAYLASQDSVETAAPGIRFRDADPFTGYEPPSGRGTTQGPKSTGGLDALSGGSACVASPGPVKACRPRDTLLKAKQLNAANIHAEPDQPLKPAWQRSCSFCGKVFYRQCDFTKHARYHLRLFLCDAVNCPYAVIGFGTQKDLLRHRTAVHKIGDIREKHLCPHQDCKRSQKAFDRKDNYRRHMRETHKEGVE
ncbi:MAG: hypothetical protein M1839_000319 [Geoglossum umbratile]|nr:MAG: hypothetical protein M1839_000319 [Geoglossum umbratile]